MALEIWNRRYTGSKYKLAGWIDELIETHCEGSSFCDIFAGTGVVAATELKRFDRVVLNDFLYSNHVIYKAFFQEGAHDPERLEARMKQWLQTPEDEMPSTFVYEQYGGRYFSARDAKIIGYLREKIEESRPELTEKEYCMLLAGLLYSADKAANTVGHYDAYIKGKPIRDTFHFEQIHPFDTSGKTIEICREDANQLARRLRCDVVYIDPPYNSRQYSRFYHVLETLTKGGTPQLFGEALKPEPENMSECCRNAAAGAFRDLIAHLDCRYLVVSYNNTYHSKSSSSRNKIELEDIVKALESRGEVEIHAKEHPYFNAGKTEFSDHKEYIFIARVTTPAARENAGGME